MNSKWIQTRQTKFSAYASAYTLIILAVLVIINLLANDRNKTYDATSAKRFSLSEQTEKVTKNLNKDVKIYYFADSKDFPAAKDLLERYSRLSRHISLEYDDPNQKPGITRAMGVNHLGQIFLESGDKREEAQALTEEEITSALVRVVKGGQRVACFVHGSGEADLEDTQGEGFSAAKDALQKNNYMPRAISLLEKPEIPTTCSVLIIANPRLAYPDPVVTAIKNYVENGGHALVMMGPVLKMGAQQSSPNAGLVSLLQSWGVTLQDNLILDASSMAQRYSSSPIVTLVTTYEDHPITRPIMRVATAFPLTRSLTVASAGKSTAKALFSTAQRSYATTDLGGRDISIDPNKDKSGPFVIGAAGTYDTGKPNQTGRFVVVGSSVWAANSGLNLPGVANRDLFLNMMNWLTADEDLISIRPKDPEDRRLSLSRGQIYFVRLVSQFLIPLTMLIFGIAVWWRRR